MTSDVAEHQLSAADKALTAGAFDQAIEAYESVLSIQPDHLGALRGITQALRHFNRNDRVVALFQAAATSAPSDVEILTSLVESLIANGQVEEARAQGQAALGFHPDAIALRLLLAHTDMIGGDRKAARKIFWDVLEQDPENADCAYHLADIAPQEELDRLSTALAPMWLHRTTRESWDAATLGYAYGKTAQRQGGVEKAWKGFSFGAQQKRSIIRYDESQMIRIHNGNRYTFSSKTPSPDEASRPGLGFIFIASLPRSGSTLVEQILDAHASVRAIGERSFVVDAMNYWQKTHGPDPARLFSAEAISDTRAFYADKARAAAGDSSRVIVDKSITNYIFLGFLRILMPGARFLHVTRDPLDIAVSCFTTLFAGGNEWTYDLEEMGRNIRRQQELMGYWKEQWPNDILTVNYEKLVEAPETETRKILSYCGLDWDMACLDFHQSQQPVLTASMHQVRQPIYQTAKGRAANYRGFLKPLITAMGRVGTQGT